MGCLPIEIEMNRRPAEVGVGDSLAEWIKEVPLVTKLLVAGTFGTTFMDFVGICSANTFTFSSYLIFKKFQLWRLVTPFLYSFGFSPNFFFHIYLLYENSRRYEMNPFNTGGGGNSADFLYMILLGMAVMCVIAHFFELTQVVSALLYMIMYVWSRKEPDTMVSSFTLQYKAIYSPWISLAIYLVMGNDVTQPLIGIAVGHVYFFFTSILPVSHEIDIIHTPEFCVSIFRSYTGMNTASTNRPAVNPPANGAQQAPNLGAGHQWGIGRALGSD